MSEATPCDPNVASAAAQLAQVLEEVIRRRAAGEASPDEQVISLYPDLMPELGQKLRALRQVEQAGRMAENADADPGGDTQTIPASGDDGSTRLGDAEMLPADSFAGYQLLREIHRGGQGVVYQAIQKSTKRKVAIKVMKDGPFAGPGDRARFEREVQILGQLQHPNIVTVHDSGTAAGIFYFVMDYISGQPLDVYMAGAAEKEQGTKGSKDQNRVGLSIDTTLKLFGKVCAAVNAAHLRGVIHRDLKPGNIRVDPAGEPHILDFGLAKMSAFDPIGEGGAAAMTMTGQFIGSLPWASPEQAEGQPSKIDTRTDVYSLGVILYQMLTGKFPYQVIGNMRDVLDRILRAEPAKPSTVRKQINDEVETIVLKCLSKERERRYQTAGELGRDIGHYLAGEPVEAKRDSGWYVLRKHLRRFRVPLAIAASFLVLLIASSVVAWIQYGQARSRLWESYLAAARAHRETGVPGRKMKSLGAVRRAAAIRPSPELRDEAIAALALLDVQTIEERPSNEAGLMVRYAPDLARVAYIDPDRGGCVIKRWSDHATELDLSGPVRLYLTPQFSPDGRLIVRCVGTDCQIWNIERREIVSQFPVQVTMPCEADFSPDGQHIAVGDHDGAVHVHDLRTHETRVLPVAKTDIRGLSYRPGGQTLMVCTYESNDLLFVDLATGEIRDTLSLPPGGVGGGAWSADGNLFAVGSRDNRVYLWDYPTKSVVNTLVGHTNFPIAMCFIDHGAFLLTNGWDGTFRIWDPASGALILTMEGELFWVEPEGHRIVYRRVDNGLVRGIGEISTSDVFSKLIGKRKNEFQIYYSIATSRDGRLAATSGGNIELWDLARGEYLTTIPLNVMVHTVLFNRADTELISSGDQGVLRWPLVRQDDTLHVGPPVRLSPPSWQCQDASLAADGSTLAVAVNSWNVGILSLRDPTAKPRILGEHPNVRRVSISQDARWVASGGVHQGPQGLIRVWDVQKDALAKTLPGPEGNEVAFSPDGCSLVTSVFDHTVWDTTTWKERATIRRQTIGPVPSAAFSSSGDVLAVITDSHTVDLVDTRNMTTMARLESPDAIGVEALAFSADGTKLLVPDAHGHTLHVWELPTLRRHLAEMGLDWDSPPYPPAPPAQPAAPLHVEVDLGDLAQPGDELAQELNQKSWEVVKSPGSDAHSYQLALQQAETAHNRTPKDALILNTLGVAQYRAGEYERALDTLSRSDNLDRQQSARESDGVPADAAFIAMSLHKLGRAAEAQAALARLRKLARHERWSNDAESQALLAEAEALITDAPSSQPSTVNQTAATQAAPTD